MELGHHLHDRCQGLNGRRVKDVGIFNWSEVRPTEDLFPPRILRSLGYRRQRVYLGSFRDWVEKGGLVISGEEYCET